MIVVSVIRLMSYLGDRESIAGIFGASWRNPSAEHTVKQEHVRRG